MAHAIRSQEMRAEVGWRKGWREGRRERKREEEVEGGERERAERRFGADLGFCLS